MEWLHWGDWALASLGLQQVLHEQRVQRLVVVLLNQRRLDVWTKLFRLFLELVDRYLTDHQREVFNIGLMLDAIFVDTHCNVSLSSKLELLLLNQVVDVLVLGLCSLAWASLCWGLLWILRVDLGSQSWVIGKEFGCINPGDGVDWNIGCLMLEATMDVDTGIHAPHCVSEPLNGLELVPL